MMISKKFGQIVPFKEKVVLPAVINITISNLGVSKSQLVGRRCTIFRPSKNAMQAGLSPTKQVRLEFDNTQPRWESHNLAWTSSKDPFQGIVIKFESVQKAIEYCQSMGLWYAFKEEANNVTQPIIPKMYADNFAHSTGKLKVIKTK